MKPNTIIPRAGGRHGIIEPLEARIAPAGVGGALLDNAKFVSVTAGGSLLVKAGEVLTTGSGGGGIYLLYVQQGQVLVHTTDLNQDGQLDFNDVTGLSVGNGARVISFVDIHGDIVTDLNPDGTLTNSTGSLANGRDGQVLLDSNIASITLRSLSATDFTGTATQSGADLAYAHLALSTYSIYGNIYAGGGLGLPNDSTSGLHIDVSGQQLESQKYGGGTGLDKYIQVEPQIGSVYVGTAASGQHFTFGNIGSPLDIYGQLLTFVPAPGEAGASIYNVGAAPSGTAFNVGTLHAGDGGFNGAGGSVVNVALDGVDTGVNQVIAGNAGPGTTGHAGGSILNFSEVSSILGEVVLQSGNGGESLTGAGGNGGKITIASGTVTGVNAHFMVVYGNGGPGYTHGGAGGGTATGSFVTPEGKLTQALAIATTTHPLGAVGSTQTFDFNGDGYSDLVFSTSNPDQVVVALGSAGGFVSTNYIYLNAPAHVLGIAVGDFTGNGHPDIAVASGSPSNTGIAVYLSEYSSTGTFLGFSDPLYTPLPLLTNFGYFDQPIVVTKLFPGDFTGSGALGLAVVAQEYIPTDANPHTVLLFLSPEIKQGHGTGYFYGDFSNSKGPFTDFGDNVDAIKTIFKVTALKQFAPTTGHDVIIEGKVGDQSFNVFDDSSLHPVQISNAGYGLVLPAGSTTAVQFNVQDLTVVQDPLDPTRADIVALSQSPNGFLVTFTGDGKGNFTLASGTNKGIDLSPGGVGGLQDTSNLVSIITVPAPSTASGFSYSDVTIYQQESGGSNLITANFKPAMDTLSPITPSATLNKVGTITPGNGIDADTVVWGQFSDLSGGVSSAYGWIVANPLTTFPDDQVFRITDPGFATYDLGFKLAGYFFQAGNGGDSQAGPGGNGGSFGQSLAVVSNAATATTAYNLAGTGSLNIVFPADTTYEGTIRLIAGNGGNGFGAGGQGGSLTGLSITYQTTTELTGDALLFAGNGGQSLTGAGGTGGTISQVYVVSGELFVGGNGGIGLSGGSGGSLLGNTQPGLLTSQTNNLNPDLILRGGDGASGINAGGSGGNVLSFINYFQPIVGGFGGYLNYTAGSAGDAVAGRGGTGGSVQNSSPAVVPDNNLSGDIYITGGAGGSGRSGGAGGGVTAFNQVSSIKNTPTSSTFIGGAGGAGTIGAGGAGGSVSNITAAAAGNGHIIQFDFSDPALVYGVADALQQYKQIFYNRIIAGEGGVSTGGAGGAGGSISNVTGAAQGVGTQYVVAAGAGGSGLTAGGAGGGVFSASIDAGSSAGGGKILIIAGDGGDSYSVAPAAVSKTDPQYYADLAQAIASSIGSVSGPGGRGGSIETFAQSTNTGANVDLIAGNGGSTVNHSAAQGTVAVDNAGQGGSIIGVSVVGSIGNIDPTVAIKSYNNVLLGQTMQQFVDSSFLGDPTPQVTDAIGNVGLVAGGAGRVTSGVTGFLTPAENGVSGSVSNVRAANIMSMVAGNVDQVDLIQNLSNYAVTTNAGVLGANKLVYYNPQTDQNDTTVSDPTTGSDHFLQLGQLNYISPSGAYVNTPLPGGGQLIDGAFVSKNVHTPVSIRDFFGTSI